MPSDTKVSEIRAVYKGRKILVLLIKKVMRWPEFVDEDNLQCNRDAAFTFGQSLNARYVRIFLTCKFYKFKMMNKVNFFFLRQWTFLPILKSLYS